MRKDKASDIVNLSDDGNKTEESNDEPSEKPGFKAVVNDENASEKEERTGSVGKIRRSRWDVQPKEDSEAGEKNQIDRKRKSRWACNDSQLKILRQIQLPSFVKLVDESKLDPEISELNAELLEINWKLDAAKHLMDWNVRNKLIEAQRQIMSRLAEKSKSKAHKLKKKFSTKLYVPSNEYPGYKFIGLICGPRGITQKRMERETGALIQLRGKGANRKDKPQPYDEEDLHVLIEADDEGSFNKAVEMVEKLLIPVADEMNDLKISQLRKLTQLRAENSLEENSLKQKCGNKEHNRYICPAPKSGSHILDPCDTCGGIDHSTPNCPLTSAASGNEFNSFLYGRGPKTETKSSVSDYTSIFVTCLPKTVNSERLRELFTPFGSVLDAEVVMDRCTGTSKSFGFVTYHDTKSAADALARMNGYEIDGKRLSVGISRKQPVSSAILPQDSTDQSVCPGPPGSELSFSKGLGLGYGAPPPPSISSLNKQLIPSYGSVSSHQISPSLPSSFTEFPGNPDYISVKGEGFGLPLPSVPLSSVPLGYPNSFAKQLSSTSVPLPSVPLGYPNSFTKQLSSTSVPLPPVPLGYPNSFTKQLSSTYGSSSYQVSIAEPSSLAEFPGNPDYPNSRSLSYFTPPYFTPPAITPVPEQHYPPYLGSSRTSLPPIHHPQSDTKFVESRNDKFTSYMPW